MSPFPDQYPVDYEEIMDMMSELETTAFPDVEADVFDSSRPAAEPVKKSFTTSVKFEQLTPVGAVVVMSDNAYQKTANSRWRSLRNSTCYLTTLDLIAVLLRSTECDLVIVVPATAD